MNKHEYICAVCDVVRAKSGCAKRKVGAVFVNADFEILATGYNAPPRGFPHCDFDAEVRHTCGSPCSRNIHAEMNAVCQAAKRGTALEGSRLYCTYAPCVECARVLVNLRVKAVHYMSRNDDGGLAVLDRARIPHGPWGREGDDARV